MATLEELRSSLESARQLHGIVTTMQALAAVNLRQFERVADSLGEFRRALQLGFQAVLSGVGLEARNDQPPPEGPVIAVILGSDQGMAGPFNDRVADHAHDVLSELPGAADDARLLVMGGRARSALVERGLEVQATVPVPASPAGMADSVQELLLKIDRWHGRRGEGAVWLVHNRPEGGASYVPHELRLLPIETSWLEALRGRPWPGRGLPGFVSDPEALFEALVRRHLESMLFLAVAESVAAENAARIASMQSAERSIEDHVDELAQAFRRRRQESITEELLDIVAGFEALSSGDAHG